MKNFFLLLALFFSLTSCSINNYYLCTVDEPVEVYSTQNLNAKIATIQKSKQLVAEGNGKKYRKVRFGTSTGYIHGHKFSSEVKVTKYQLPSLITITDTSYHVRIPIRYTPSSGTVSVKDYYRKDGTYVRPHTRSAPKRH